jgi:hypothetical protein
VLPCLLLAGLALWFLQQRFQRGPVFVQPAPAPVPVTGTMYRISGPTQVQTLPTNMQAPAESVAYKPSAPVVVVSPAKSVYSLGIRSKSPRPAHVLTPLP